MSPASWNRQAMLMLESKARYLRFLEHGPALIEAATEGCSLRELSRRCGLSVTYLSLVKNGHQAISPSAYVRVAQSMGGRRASRP